MTGTTVHIKFNSSLTAEDENQVVPRLIAAVSALLDALPIAYALRIETSDAQVYQHSHPTRAIPVQDPESPQESGGPMTSVRQGRPMRFGPEV